MIAISIDSSNSALGTRADYATTVAPSIGDTSDMGGSFEVAIVTGNLDARPGLSVSTPVAMARTLAGLDATVMLVGRVAESPETNQFLHDLSSAGIDITDLELLGSPPDHSTYRLPIDRMFSAGCCLLDLDNADRVRFLVDLPVHTWPGAKLACSLTELSQFPLPIAREVLARIDTVAGTVEEAVPLAGAGDATDTVEALQRTMSTGNLRLALLSGPDSTIHAIGRSASLLRRVETTPEIKVALLCAAVLATARRLDLDTSLELAASLARPNT